MRHVTLANAGKDTGDSANASTSLPNSTSASYTIVLLMQKSYSRTVRRLVCAFLLFSVLLPDFASGQTVDPSLYGGLHWRMIGPFRGGRTIAVSGIESQPNVYYFGSV